MLPSVSARRPEPGHIYGADDTNTPTQTSADRLASLDNPHIRVVVFEGSGHALEDPPGSGDRLFREDALSLIRDFIESATARQ